MVFYVVDYVRVAQTQTLATQSLWENNFKFSQSRLVFYIHTSGRQTLYNFYCSFPKKIHCIKYVQERRVFHFLFFSIPFSPSPVIYLYADILSLYVVPIKLGSFDFKQEYITLNRKLLLIISSEENFKLLLNYSKLYPYAAAGICNRNVI